MKRSRELVEIIDEPFAMIAALQRFLERREAGPQSSALADKDVPEQFDRYLPGKTYGRFGETIERREVRRAGIPVWFDPRITDGQFGIIGPDGLRCYFAVKLDDALRDQPSVFDLEIVAFAERTPEQTSLL